MEEKRMKVDEIKAFNVDNLATAKLLVEKHNADEETQVAATEYREIVSNIQMCKREIAKYTEFMKEQEKKAKLFAVGKARKVE